MVSPLVSTVSIVGVFHAVVIMVAACFAALGLARGSSMAVCARVWLVLAVLGGGERRGEESPTSQATMVILPVGTGYERLSS